MRIHYDFFDGFVSDNIIEALSFLSGDAVVLLFQKNILRQHPSLLLTYKSLKSESIGNYSEITNVPVLDFFYGSNSTIVPTYTPNDPFVIAALDSLPARELDNLAAFVADLFPNDLVNYNEYPSANLIALYRKRSLPTRAYKEDVDITFGYKQYRLDIKPELLRFANSHYSKAFIFHSDYLADIATYFGVSLHWVFHMKHPVFCQTNTADEIFDRYTLMSVEQQALFCSLLVYILEHPASSPLDLLKKGGRKVCP